MCCSSHTYCVGTSHQQHMAMRPTDAYPILQLPADSAHFLCVHRSPSPLPRGTSRYMKRDRIANVEQTRMKCRANTETFIKTRMTLCVCTAHHNVEQRENTILYKMCIIYTCKSEKFTRIYIVATHMYTHIHIYGHIHAGQFPQPPSSTSNTTTSVPPTRPPPPSVTSSVAMGAAAAAGGAITAAEER